VEVMYDKFWGKVNRGPDCWVWNGPINTHGYGNYCVNGRSQGAHRYSYELHYGSIPKGLFICHTCDNPSCVRPDHLFIGNSRTNADDCVKKRRTTWGDKNPMSKFTNAQVRAIREEFRIKRTSKTVLARRFDVERRTIDYMINRQTYKDVV
jgi:hypothetical protein